MSSSTMLTKALCLLLVVIAVMVGAASAAAADKPLPGSCLTAASTLCANADTNAMRCLRKLAMKSDARVPSACAEAIMAGMAATPRAPSPKPNGARTRRVSQLSRLLTEGAGPNCLSTGGNGCPNTFGAISHSRCNDVNDPTNPCGGCSKGTFTVTISAIMKVQAVPATQGSNPNGLRCSNICCKGQSDRPVCCMCKCCPHGATPAYKNSVSTKFGVTCHDSRHPACNAQ